MKLLETIQISEIPDDQISVNTERFAQFDKNGIRQIFDIDQADDIPEILVACGVFKSKKEVKNNWKRGLKLTHSLTVFRKIGKLNASLMVYKPNSGLEVGLVED